MTAPTYGEWMSARVSDTTRPMGRQFILGEYVFYRNAGLLKNIPCRHILKTMPVEGRSGVRRWVSINQLDGATDQHATCGWKQQDLNSALWQKLEPKHAGFYPGGLLPRRSGGLDVVVLPRNPETTNTGFQMDTTQVASAPPNMILVAERGFWLTSPKQPSRAQAIKDIQESLGHERRELRIKGDLVDELWPNISNADREICMDEMEGIAHTLTIIPEGFVGKDADIRYLRESYYPMLERWGFKAQADEQRRTDQQGGGA